MADERAERCELCRFWDVLDSVNPHCSKICRRFPPQLSGTLNKGTLDFFWPITNKNDWCGEFQQGRDKPDPRLEDEYAG